MSDTNSSLEDILFNLAVQKPTASERAAFLDHACRDNHALRARLDDLLESHFGAALYLAAGASSLSRSLHRPSGITIGLWA